MLEDYVNELCLAKQQLEQELANQGCEVCFLKAELNLTVEKMVSLDKTIQELKTTNEELEEKNKELADSMVRVEQIQTQMIERQEK